MKLRCPCCHASNSLEAFTADDAGRELLVLVASTGPLFRPLVAYLGLFRPASRDLSHDRAMRLAREVLALAENVGATGRSPLQQALTETVEAMRAKRDGGQVKPLTNHNYLRKVLETVAGAPSPPAPLPVGEGRTPAAPRSKRAQALAALEAWGNE